MKNNNDWKERLNVVYSTNPNFNYETDDDEEQVTLAPAQQNFQVIVGTNEAGNECYYLSTPVFTIELYP